jgi:glycogen debranching enzyme
VARWINLATRPKIEQRRAAVVAFISLFRGVYPMWGHLLNDGSSFAATELPLTLPLTCGGLTVRLDAAGMIPQGNNFGGGLYFDDTRYLRTAYWTLGGRPLRLVPTKQRGGYSAMFRYGNTPFQSGDEKIPEHHLRVRRGLVIHDGSLYEQLRVFNSHPEPVVAELAYHVSMDAAHIFHVRGFAFDEESRGRIHSPVMARTSTAPAVVFRYKARDGQWVHTVLEFLSQKADRVQMRGNRDADPLTGTCCLTYRFRLDPGRSRRVELRTTPILARSEPLLPDAIPLSAVDPTPPLPRLSGIKPTDAPWSFSQGWRNADEEFRLRRAGHARITTSNPAFNRLLAISERDLHTLWLRTAAGNTWAAGVPWYDCPFGRDSAVTGDQVLPFQLEEVRDVLLFHAAHLGTRWDPERAQVPGKAFHEKRGGELARLGKISHGIEPYYGSIDSTPLFLRLFANYVIASGDLDFARQLWPQVELCLSYIGYELERGCGWLVYGLDPKQALAHQGWKDSGHGIRRGDGSPSRHPIALVEVQAYLYEALVKIARVCEALASYGNGSDTDAAKTVQAATLRKLAADLKGRFLEKFVTPDGCFLALALDGQGPSGISKIAEHQVLTVTTNAGHALSTGILPPDLATQVAQRLAQPDMLHRWGLVATASSTKGWNPEGYHDGIWVWDNGEVLKGLCAVGATELAHHVIQRQFELVRHTPDGRMPELVCGYNTKRHRPWPQACAPQAWSAGAVFKWVVSLLGLKPNGLEGVLEVIQPSLPPFLEWLSIDNLRVGHGTVSFRLERNGGQIIGELSNPDGVAVVTRGFAFKQAGLA